MVSMETRWRLQKKLAGDAKVIVDVGAGTGHTVARYLQFFPNAIIYAFEPAPASIRKFRSRVRDRRRVKLFEVAVLDKVGTVPFHLYKIRDHHSVLKPTSRFRHLPQRAAKIMETIKVPTITLDVFCEKQGINRIDILKIDVQGAEVLALKGAVKLLAENRIGMIYTELNLWPFYKNQAEIEEVVTFLKTYGYRFHSWAVLGKEDGDGIFLPYIQNLGAQDGIVADAVGNTLNNLPSLCIVKQSSMASFTWESTRYPGASKLLKAFPYRSQNISLVAGFRADIWVVDGHDVGARAVRGHDPGGLLPMRAAHKTVSQSAVPFGDYDIVLTMGPIFSPDLMRRYPEKLWCYYEEEHRTGRSSSAAARGPAPGYDLYLDHYLRPTNPLVRLPQSVAFPYLANSRLMRELISPRNDPAVFVDSRHVPFDRRKFERICGLPVRCIAETSHGFAAIAAGKIPGAAEYLRRVGECKYYLMWRKKAVVGQAALEAAALGLIVVANSNGVYHKMFCHPLCLIPPGGPPRKGLRVIQKLEDNSDAQLEILAHQNRRLRERFWEQPLGLLCKGLEMKRK